MRQNYGTQLTRDYLEYLGVTEVSVDGTKIMKGDQELTQHECGGYRTICLYDPAKRKLIPMEDRANTTGQLHLGVHRIVYSWYHRIIPDGMVVDHVNNNKFDNRLENLQLLTPGENIWKERESNTKEIKCKMNKPRSFYEDKLTKYEALYEEAKANHDAKATHKLRSNIAQTRARLRYWDAHKDEYQEGPIKMKKEKTEFQRDLEELVYWKQRFKEAGNKAMWHQCCKVEKLAKTSPIEEAQKIVAHALEVIHRTFD